MTQVYKDSLICNTHSVSIFDWYYSFTTLLGGSFDTIIDFVY